MQHDICYRGNDTKEGKHARDGEMLKELDALEPNGIREKMDWKLVKRDNGISESNGAMDWSTNYTNR